MKTIENEMDNVMIRTNWRKRWEEERERERLSEAEAAWGPVPDLVSAFYSTVWR